MAAAAIKHSAGHGVMLRSFGEVVSAELVALHLDNQLFCTVQIGEA